MKLLPVFLRSIVLNDVISMAPRQLVPLAVEESKDYPGHTTLYVILACILAASGGLLFGYDIGISGKPPSFCPPRNELPKHRTQLW